MCIVELISTGDGQMMLNTRQYRNKTVYVGCTERTSVVFFFILLFVLCSASVSNSLYISTAKWDTSHISEEDRLLVRI
jgi:hypothetical protein